MRTKKPKQTPSSVAPTIPFGKDTASRVATLVRDVSAARRRMCDIEVDCVKKAESIERILTHRRAKHARNAIAQLKIEGDTHE